MHVQLSFCDVTIELDHIVVVVQLSMSRHSDVIVSSESVSVVSTQMWPHMYMSLLCVLVCMCTTSASTSADKQTAYVNTRVCIYVYYRLRYITYV